MQSKSNPLISVVIPTAGRPVQVAAAVNSALQQTFKDLEVIVVIDGDDQSLAALKSVDSPQLQILQLPKQVGGARARNEGVHVAKGEWIAFLDDDDAWVPEKLERQLAVARASRMPDPIVSCKVMARTQTGEFVWPRKLPSEPLSEYLLARNSWRQGEGLLQTSTLLTTRRLLLEIGFEDGLRKHQDWDWLLRVVKMPGVGIEFIDAPLVIWNLASSPSSVSRKCDWQGSLAWIRQRRELVTRRAYAAFIATSIASQAARQRQWRAFIPLLTEMFRLGSPKAIDIFLLMAMWFVPGTLRERLRTS
ncbi:glycosyltransferase family 2 protein [Alloacidobacterium sp.]|uniref:glycosyltransferase family 2 protein n=1 Tax=Alloacidobacterium sp. TaxID=2951999 RepID=UPI002D4E701C|nr:glycosyltransferase [Alloacidobacterium sp.]HYK36743.1 glycosyltransferase [Alloacidobacterium sp.]